MKKQNINYLALLIAASSFGTMADLPTNDPKVVNVELRNGVEFAVSFRDGLPLDAARARYEGFKPETQILKKGSIRRDGALPLPSDILFERDVAITLRDGTVIYADIFRPVEEGNYPAIMAWSPYGKQIGGQWLDDLPNRTGVTVSQTSQLEKFEGPDPAYWVNQGYVIINPDKRGAYSSEGNLHFWGHADSKDGYDVIEWAATQPWSNGKIGMSGNSWLTVSQWFIASEMPPHLAAIAPWEGFSDHFRESSHRGGIPDMTFPEIIVQTFASKNLVENQPKMIVDYPLMNDYWEDKAPILENIKIPAYIVASYTNEVHTRGTFEGWNRISSPEKWLRVHNTHEWFDYYTPENVKDLNKFFDRYLKGIENGWENTPKVRLSVLNPGGEDIVNRVENEFPLARTEYQKLYLNAHNWSLKPDNSNNVLSAEYNSNKDGSSLNFTYKFDQDTEITGYMKLRLWVEAVDNDDMDLLVSVGKLSPEGNVYADDVKATGLMRVSMRETDPVRSKEEKPYYYYRQAMPLTKGEIVPIDIEIWPIAMQFNQGEQLELIVKPFTYPNVILPFGSAKIDVPVDTFTYMPNENVKMMTVGGDYKQVANSAEITSPPALHNKGIHRFYMGDKYDSYLYIPVIPAKK